MAYLNINSISKKFERTIALDDISLEIEEGEFVFLLGPSGCGKTTLLRIIAGLEKPSSGRIFHEGIDVTYLPPSRHNFGIVFQSYALFPNLSVYSNIAYGLENRKEPKEAVEARVKELLSLVGLDGLESRYPAQLSGGQQQRVALARALAISPGLLLLDEPLSALDARVRANLRIEIARLQRQLGITTVMVSHDQEEALTMADRVVVMEKGRNVQIGAPEEIYHHPSTPFVADFVGLMNFIFGTVAQNNSKHVIVGSDILEVQHHIEQLPGEPVSLAIRPEEIQVTENGHRSNILHTRVNEVEFIGPFYRLHLDHEALKNRKMLAYLPPAGVKGKKIQEGMVIPIYLPPFHLRVFPSNPSKKD